MHIHHHLSRAALFGALLLIIGCDRSSARYLHQVADACPSGWKVSTNTNGIVLRREATVWILGKVSNPPPDPYSSVEHYFKTVGREIHYEIRLRFIPLLSLSKYEKLKLARQEAATRFNQGASGKDEYTHWQIQYEECQVPVLFTTDYSIFVDRWADGGTNFGYRIEPLFTDVYPPEAASEIEAVIKNLNKVFRQYENPGTPHSAGTPQSH
jgi:hypothetical protein